MREQKHSMSLHQTILADMNEAMKSRDAERLSVLRMLKAALLNTQKETGSQDDLPDDAVLSVLQKEAKKRKESIDAFTKGGRAELAAQEQSELTVIEAYLPAELSDEELGSLIDAVIADAGDAPQFGAVMGKAMQAVAGRADGNRVRQILQQRLQQ